MNISVQPVNSKPEAFSKIQIYSAKPSQAGICDSNITVYYCDSNLMYCNIVVLQMHMCLDVFTVSTMYNFFLRSITFAIEVASLQVLARSGFRPKAR